MKKRSTFKRRGGGKGYGTGPARNQEKPRPHIKATIRKPAPRARIRMG